MAKLNKKQTPLTSKQLKNIETEIRLYNDYMDGINQKLVDAVEKYQKAYEKILREKNFDIVNGKLKKTMANINKAQSINSFSKLGFSKLSIGYMKEYNNVVHADLNLLEGYGINLSTSYRDVIKSLDAIKAADYTIFNNEAIKLDLLIQKRLIDGVILQDDYQKLVSGLADDLLGAGEKSGMLARYANTYMNTALMSISRVADNQVYSKVGGDKKEAQYIMAGPIDAKTSQICMQYVGQTLTREEWETIGVNEGVDVFSMGLHWNCRHRWILVDLLL